MSSSRREEGWGRGAKGLSGVRYGSQQRVEEPEHAAVGRLSAASWCKRRAPRVLAMTRTSAFTLTGLSSGGAPSFPPVTRVGSVVLPSTFSSRVSVTTSSAYARGLTGAQR